MEEPGMTREQCVSSELLGLVCGSRDDRVDLLADLAGLESWLGRVGLAGPGYPVTPRSLKALRRAREAIRGHQDHPTCPSACAELNAVLQWGRRGLAVTPRGPRTSSLVDDVDLRAAWEAAMDYVQLLHRYPAESPSRCGPPPVR